MYINISTVYCFLLFTFDFIMPVFFQHNINQSTRLIVWHLQESEEFFLSKVKKEISITHTHKKLQHLCGRFLLSYLFNDFPYDQLIIDDFGKPLLKNKQYYFSISHSKNYVTVIASKDYTVGIDIEMMQPRALKIISKFLSEKEQRNLGIDNEKDATLCWAIKEAVYKCYGSGFYNFKDKIDIQSIKDERIAKVLIDNDAIVVVDYRIIDNLVLSWVSNI